MSSLVTVNLLNTNSVKYGSVPIQRIMRGSTLLWPNFESFVLYYNNKYYKVNSIVNNQYVMTEIEPYYYVEIFSPYDWPLGVQASINTKVEVWTTQMLSGDHILIGNIYNEGTNGMFNLRTNGYYFTGNAIKFNFGSTDSNTSSSVKSSGSTELSYNTGNYTSSNLIGGYSDRIIHITAGNVDGNAKMILEYKRTNNNTSGTITTRDGGAIKSFYQGTFEESELHLKFVGATQSGGASSGQHDYAQAKIYKIRIWDGNTIVRDLRWRFRNNVMNASNIYLWDDITQAEIIPTIYEGGTLNYSTNNQGTQYLLQGVESPWPNGYYTINGTITEDGVTYEKLVNSLDNTKYIKGIVVQ